MYKQAFSAAHTNHRLRGTRQLISRVKKTLLTTKPVNQLAIKWLY